MAIQDPSRSSGVDHHVVVSGSLREKMDELSATERLYQHSSEVTDEARRELARNVREARLEVINFICELADADIDVPARLREMGREEEAAFEEYLDEREKRQQRPDASL